MKNTLYFSVTTTTTTAANYTADAANDNVLFLWV